MMGQLASEHERLFYSFNLEDHNLANHLLRSIDRCLDLSDLQKSCYVFMKMEWQLTFFRRSSAAFLQLIGNKKRLKLCHLPTRVRN